MKIDMSDNNRNLKSTEDKIAFEIRRLLKRKNPVVVALDGRSGTGKSTIAQIIAGRVEGIILVGDDFYSGGNDDAWSGFSAKEKVDKVIDWQRMRVQVLEPLLAKKPASWHPLDFKPEIGWVVGWEGHHHQRQPSSVFKPSRRDFEHRPETIGAASARCAVEIPCAIRN